ncbi:uncharacterized protein LOC115926405 [Strongylocentrotus purpuratus]|uniref:Uncharacterized protein n=1 Tax=Strongylocentrotus purpuratus TaxID=7668 RepID=A0A7M7P8Y8_STRPU|nr:uncharacterized protein LOC100887838 [Strongylocentrotus purpuratus]XP_030846952.1 uncharacterized protein LOC115926405 [Strongylocentrotus purpuratus]|eukprot:XP_003726218.1 PREDICTED: putative deoxyribonuclease TATDN1 [Strongylocentrotus purpuratus]
MSAMEAAMMESTSSSSENKGPASARSSEIRKSIVHELEVYLQQPVLKLQGNVIEYWSRRETRGQAVGVHLKYVSMLTDDGWDKLKCLFACPRVTAVSEQGIDYFCVPQAEWPRQWDFVRRVLGLGCRNMVLVLHLRPAQGDPCGHHLHGEFRDLLRQFCGHQEHIHIHNFTGDAQELDAWMVAFQNVYDGVSGLALSFNPAQVDMVRSIPSPWLLLETDSPYLPMFPGASVNTPYLLEDVGRLVSQIWGQHFRAVMKVSTENAQRLYSGFACLVMP